MLPTSETLVARHFQAKKNLDIKLRNIPQAVFPAGRWPTILEIYTNSSSCYVPTIPPELQLDYVFKNYNRLVEIDFRARQYHPDRLLQIAVFHWQIDQQHSYSARHGEIRWNVLLAHILLETPSERAKMDESLVLFLKEFILAWIDMAMHVPAFESWACKSFAGKRWKDSKYDLIRFGKQSRSKMKALVKQLEICVPPLDYNPVNFWEVAKTMPEEKMKAYGPAWAMQYIIYMEKFGEAKGKKARADDAEESLVSGGFFAGFGNLGMADEMIPELTEAVFEQELVKALLVDIADNTVVLPREDTAKEKAWMNEHDAVAYIRAVIEGEQGVEDMVTAIQQMSFLRP